MENNYDSKDTMLNRERTNIVSATIEANRNIDEKKARDINNQIKVENKNPVKIFLIAITVLLVSMGIALIISMGTKKLIGNTTTTTTVTTTKKITFMENYLNRDSLKKFEGNGEFTFNNSIYNKLILILAPNSITNKYLLIFNNEKDNYIEYGEYSIINNEILLTSNENVKSIYNILEDSIMGKISLKIMDTEMKAYSYQVNNVYKLLIMNATKYAEYALYLENDKIILSKFTEDDYKIEINGKEFIKKNGILSVDGYTLNNVK